MKNSLLNKIIPGFSELEIFVACYSLLLTGLAYSREVMEFVNTIVGYVLTLQGIERFINGYVIYAVAFVLFIYLGLYHALSTRKKNLFEKSILFLFMFALHIAVVLRLMFAHADSALGKVLLIWNILYLVVLVLYVYHSVSETRAVVALLRRMVKDEHVPRLQVLVSAYATSALFIVMTFINTTEWFLVFALLIVTMVPATRLLYRYTSFINKKSTCSLPNRRLIVTLLVPLVVVYVFGVVG